MDYTVGAEIGVYKGEYTKLFCDEGIQMYAIDPWEQIGKNQKRQDFLCCQLGKETKELQSKQFYILFGQF